ncbi:MAG: hypothetical protein KGZ81_07430 [Flavobacteriales bacterium]|nr:hypothetical protein [Flavobacteriales bacterium]
MYKYKTKNGKELVIPGVGKTVNGEITSSVKLNSPSLQLIESAQPEPQAQPAPTPVAADGAVIGVAPQATVAAAPQPNSVQSTAPVQPQPINQEQNQQ